MTPRGIPESHKDYQKSCEYSQSINYTAVFNIIIINFVAMISIDIVISATATAWQFTRFTYAITMEGCRPNHRSHYLKKKKRRRTTGETTPLA